MRVKITEDRHPAYGREGTVFGYRPEERHRYYVRLDEPIWHSCTDAWIYEIKADAVKFLDSDDYIAETIAQDADKMEALAGTAFTACVYRELKLEN